MHCHAVDLPAVYNNCRLKYLNHKHRSHITSRGHASFTDLNVSTMLTPFRHVSVMVRELVF